MAKNGIGRRSVLDDPQVEKAAIGLLVGGATKTAVALAIGASRPAVSRWANKEEIQEWIGVESEKYIASLPDALAVSQNLLAAGRKESGKLLLEKPGEIDHKVLELAAREASDMRKSLGITPSQSGAVLIQNIYNDNRAVISPAVQALLDAHLGAVIDVDPEPQPEAAPEEES